MESADEDYHHASRDDACHLSDLEWQAVQRMTESVGDAAVGAMLLSLSGDEQYATIAKFIQHGLDEAMRKLTLLQEQGAQQADLLRQQGSQQSELLRHSKQVAAAAGSMHMRRPESLKIDVSKYKAVESDSLLRWFVELDDAIEARRIDDDVRIYDQRSGYTEFDRGGPDPRFFAFNLSTYVVQ